MKKVFCLIILLSLISVKSVFAVETSSPSAKTQDLLDRVTTKVAELTNQLRRTYYGKIKSLGTTSISLSTPEGDRSISTNDVTSFFRIRSGNKTEVNFSALKVGDDIVGIGTVDPQNSEMTAKQVIAKVQRYNIVGTISEVNKTIVTVQEFSGKTSTVDLADALALKKADATKKIQTAKISDFQKDSTVFIIGYLLDSKAESFSTLKALVYQK